VLNRIKVCQRDLIFFVDLKYQLSTIICAGINYCARDHYIVTSKTTPDPQSRN